MKTIRTKQAKVHFAYFVQHEQHGLIAKDLTYHKAQFQCDVFVFVSVAVVPS